LGVPSLVTSTLWVDVPVDDQVLMRVLDGAAYPAEELERAVVSSFRLSQSRRTFT
jgi:hypothetical protein